MSWKRKLFESYNKAMEAACDLYVKERGKEAADGLEDSVFEKYGKEAEVRWNGTPSAILEGRTPAEAINGIVSLADSLELYKEACIICDDSIPAILKEKLKSFGSEAEDRLIGLACSRTVSEQDEAFMVPILSIRLLGEWKAVRSAPELIGLLMDCEPDELMLMEEIEHALVKIGDTGVMLEGMGPAECWSHPQEYLASALAKAGKLNRKDSIYKCLKEYFLKYEKIVLGASNLAEYGDSRAIPVLRGYAERRLASLGREVFYEIKSAVETLGGNMDDLAIIYGRLQKLR